MRRYDPDKMLALLNFLCWYEQEDPNALWGGVRIKEAIQGLQHVLGLDNDDAAFARLKEISLGIDLEGE